MRTGLDRIVHLWWSRCTTLRREFVSRHVRYFRRLGIVLRESVTKRYTHCLMQSLRQYPPRFERQKSRRLKRVPPEPLTAAAPPIPDGASCSARSARTRRSGGRRLRGEAHATPARLCHRRRRTRGEQPPKASWDRQRIPSPHIGCGMKR